jgi:hypothetical protein
VIGETDQLVIQGAEVERRLSTVISQVLAEPHQQMATNARTRFVGEFSRGAAFRKLSNEP